METFVAMGCDVAMRAAAEYCRRNGKSPDVDVLIAELRRECKAAVDIALTDAKAAADAGMYEIARATFAATYRLAGIKAAESAIEMSLTVRV